MSNDYDFFIKKLHSLIQGVNARKEQAPTQILQILDCLSTRSASANKLIESSEFTTYEYEVARRKQANGFCRKIDSLDRLKTLISPDDYKKLSNNLHLGLAD